MTICWIPETMLSTENTATNNTVPALMELTFKWKRETIHPSYTPITPTDYDKSYEGFISGMYERKKPDFLYSSELSFLRSLLRSEEWTVQWTECFCPTRFIC